MYKIRFVCMVLLLAAMIVPYRGSVALAAGQQGLLSTGSQSRFVNLYIDQVKFLGNTGDINGTGEFRLLILAADTTGKSSGMFCPGNAALRVRKGDIVNSPCLLAISFDEDKVSNGVYLTVMAVDEDKSSLPADLSYEAASGYLAGALSKAVTNGAVNAGVIGSSSSTPFTFVAGVLFSFLSGKIKEWIERADIIGSQGIYLSRKDNWSADKTNTVTSSDGGIQITYTIVRTSSTPSSAKAPVLGAAPKSGSSTGSAPKTSQNYWCDDLSLVKLKVGDDAKVTWMKINLRTAPIVPQEYYGNSIAQLEEGTKLTIIGGPACAHEGTWWQVRTRKGQVGWVREHISKGYLIGK